MEHCYVRQKSDLHYGEKILFDGKKGKTEVQFDMVDTENFVLFDSKK